MKFVVIVTRITTKMFYLEKYNAFILGQNIICQGQV